MYKILIIGGTGFIGRSLVEKLKDNREYKITIANRGITNPNLFENLERLNIDRNIESSCRKLFKNFYDFVFDFSGYEYNQLYYVNKYIRCHKYIYISTVSVLYSYNDKDMMEYSRNKLDCEKFIIENSNYDNYTIVRTPCIVGTNDNTGRFYEKDGEFFWKNTGMKASECMNVDQFSQVLLNEINGEVIDKKTLSFK